MEPRRRAGGGTSASSTPCTLCRRRGASADPVLVGLLGRGIGRSGPFSFTRRHSHARRFRPASKAFADRRAAKLEWSLASEQRIYSQSAVPLTLIDTRPLFRPLTQDIVALLRTLPATDWERPTVAGTWRVRDVVAHLLDTGLRTLTVVRDGGKAPPPDRPISNERDLGAFLNGLNARGFELQSHSAPACSPTSMTGRVATLRNSSRVRLSKGRRGSLFPGPASRSQPRGSISAASSPKSGITERRSGTPSMPDRSGMRDGFRWCSMSRCEACLTPTAR